MPRAKKQKLRKVNPCLALHGSAVKEKHNWGTTIWKSHFKEEVGILEHSKNLE